MTQMNRKQKAEHQFAKALLKGVPARKTPGPVADAGHTVIFTVRYSNGAYNTNRVRGQSGSSTSSRMDAANRLAGKLAGDAQSVLEQVGEGDDKGVYTYRLVVNPMVATDGQTPSGELDRAGGAS